MPPIPDEELEYTFFRSSGPGGQKKNTTDSAVRLRHLPTGVMVVATSSRSQYRNKQTALQELERRLQVMRRRRKRRVATAPTKASQERRIEDKKRRGGIKTTRGTPERED